jgi:hypothetical protein
MSTAPAVTAGADPETGVKTLRKDDDLGPEYELEPVREERLQTLTLDRISRIKSIKQGAAIVAGPATADAVVPQDRAEIERRRRAYMENFLKQLP